MYTKQQVLDKLNVFLAYTISQIPTLEYDNKDTFEPIYTSIVNSAKTKVTGYFEAPRNQFKKPLDDLGLYLHNEVWQREAKWGKPQDMGMGTNPPETYNDLRKIFYSFDWFMTLTEQEFYEAWVHGVKPQEPPPLTPVIEPLSNSIISRLTSELVLTATPDPITGAVSKTTLDLELEKVESLATWLETSMGQGGAVMLWEDMGALLEAPSTNDIAQVIFVDRGLLEAVKVLNLPVYIPTYLKNVEILTDWKQPILTANGTIGGSSCACRASGEITGSYDAFKAFDGKIDAPCDAWVVLLPAPQWIEFYSPETLKVDELEVTNRSCGENSRPFSKYEVLVSENGADYTSVMVGKNENLNPKGRWKIPMGGVKGKYIRLVANEFQLPTGVSINEIKIKAKLVL